MKRFRPDRLSPGEAQAIIRRLDSLWKWTRAHRFATDEEFIQYSMKRYGVSRRQAHGYLQSILVRLSQFHKTQIEEEPVKR